MIYHNKIYLIGDISNNEGKKKIKEGRMLLQLNGGRDNREMEVTMGKNKTLAAVLNFLLWGIGYLYMGKKKTFGALLFVALLVLHIPLILNGFSLQALTEQHFSIVSIGYIIISIALAYDVKKER